jgi:hypothetical protein
LRLTKTTTTKTGTTSKENNMTPKKTIQVRDLKPMKDAKGGAVANVMSNHGAASHGAASHGAASHKHAQHATRGLN